MSSLRQKLGDVRKAIALFALATLPLSCLASNITVTYPVDARPNEVLYISLLQSNQTLTGSLVDVVSNGAVATKRDTLQLSGTILNDMMSISAKVWFTNLMAMLMPPTVLSLRNDRSIKGMRPLGIQVRSVEADQSQSVRRALTAD